MILNIDYNGFVILICGEKFKHLREGNWVSPFSAKQRTVGRFFSGRISDLCSRSRHPRDKNSVFQLFFFQIPSMISIARIIFNFPPHFETLLAMGRGQTEHGKVPFQELSLSLSLSLSHRSECDKRTAVGDKTSAERQTIASLAFSGCRAGRIFGLCISGQRGSWQICDWNHCEGVELGDSNLGKKGPYDSWLDLQAR